MARKRSLFVLGIIALLISACAPVASPTPTPQVTTATSAPTATPRVAPPTATPTPTPTPAPKAARAVPRTIRMMISQEPEVQPKVLDREWTRAAMDSAVLESLMDLDKEGRPVPLLATKWEQRDPKTWRLYLRKGVKFHNGDIFSARDVVATAQWIIDEKKISHTYPLVPFEAAVLIDEYTVDLTFAKPQPLFLIQQIYVMISPTSVARDKREGAALSPIGTGPYRFVKWDRGLRLELARFEDYWGPKPQIDRAMITWRSEPSVRLAALRVGEVDWAMALVAEDAQKAPKTVSLVVPDRYVLNPLSDASVQKSPILADKRLRLAIDYALDRETMVKLFNGQATILPGHLALSGEFGFNPSLKARYDRQKAIALVREANAVGKTLTFFSHAGKRPKDRELAEAIAYMIEQTGLKVKLEIVTGSGREYYREQPSDLFLHAPDFVLESEGRLTKTFYRGSTQVRMQDEQAWKLMDDVFAELDLEKRAQKVASVWAYLHDEAHYFPLVVPVTTYGLAANLEWRVANAMALPSVANMKFTD